MTSWRPLQESIVELSLPRPSGAGAGRLPRGRPAPSFLGRARRRRRGCGGWTRPADLLGQGLPGRPPSGRCCGTTRSCTRPSAARPGSPATSTGSRWRTSWAAGVPPETSSRTARPRTIPRPVLSRRWPTSAGPAAGTSGRRCRGRRSLPRIATTQRVGELLVGRRRPAARPQVGLLAGEQAVADLAVGGEPDPVAVAAERARHRGDHADRGRAAVDQEQLGGRAAPRLLRPGVSVNSARALEGSRRR